MTSESLTILVILSGLVAMAATYPADQEKILEKIEEELRRGKSEGMEVDLKEFDEYLKEVLNGKPPPEEDQLNTALLQRLTGHEMTENIRGTKLAMLQELIKETYDNEVDDDSWIVRSQQGCEIPAVDCGNLPDFVNGQVSYTSTMEGSVATYTCDEHFHLVGPSHRTCGQNGQWSNENPACKSLDQITSCGELPSLQNGRITYSGPTIVGSEARHSCNKGHYRDGPSERVCKSDGNWSGKRTFCRGCRKWFWRCSSSDECCGNLVCKSYFFGKRRCHLF